MFQGRRRRHRRRRQARGPDRHRGSPRDGEASRVAPGAAAGVPSPSSSFCHPVFPACRHCRRRRGGARSSSQTPLLIVCAQLSPSNPHGRRPPSRGEIQPSSTQSPKQRPPGRFVNWSSVISLTAGVFFCMNKTEGAGGSGGSGGLCYCDSEQLQSENLETRSIFHLPRSFTFCFLPSHLSVRRLFACLPPFSSPPPPPHPPNVAPFSGNGGIDPLSGRRGGQGSRGELRDRNRHAADKYRPVRGPLHVRKESHHLLSQGVHKHPILITGGGGGSDLAIHHGCTANSCPPLWQGRLKHVHLLPQRTAFPQSECWGGGVLQWQSGTGDGWITNVYISSKPHL